MLQVGHPATRLLELLGRLQRPRLHLLDPLGRLADPAAGVVGVVPGLLDRVLRLLPLGLLRRRDLVGRLLQVGYDGQVGAFGGGHRAGSRGEPDRRRDRDGVDHVGGTHAGRGEGRDEQPAADGRGRVLVDHRGVQRALHLVGHRLGEPLPELLGQVAALPGDRGGELAALPGELAQRLSVEVLLGLPQRGAELEHLRHLVALVPHHHVHHPGGDRRLAERQDPLGELRVLGLGLLGPLVAGPGELRRGEGVELLGDAQQRVRGHASRIGVSASDGGGPAAGSPGAPGPRGS